MNNTSTPFVLQKIKTPNGIVLDKPVFILSPEPCCSFTALPFWAKISGKIINKTEEEKALRIETGLFDHNGVLLSILSETLIIEGKSESFFETKIKDFKDRFFSYTIEVTEIPIEAILG